jgi:hypothetical protein
MAWRGLVGLASARQGLAWCGLNSEVTIISLFLLFFSSYLSWFYYLLYLVSGGGSYGLNAGLIPNSRGYRIRAKGAVAAIFARIVSGMTL